MAGVRALLADFASYLDPQRHELLLTLNIDEPRDGIEALWAGRVTVIANTIPYGFAANHNAALRHARGSLFAVMDPELRLHGNPFPRLAKVLSAPKVGIASTLILDEHGEAADNARSVPTPAQVLGRRWRRSSTSYQRHLDREMEVDWIAGLFMAMRAETFRQLGGFDPGYYLYCEDADLCLRAWNAGMQVRVVPAAAVTHIAQRQSLKKWQHFIWHCRSLMRLWRAPSYRGFRSLRRR